MFKEKISGLLDKEMDRKDFIKNVGLAVVALAGLSALTRVFGSQTTTTTKRSAQTSGYGATSYGGNTPVRTSQALR